MLEHQASGPAWNASPTCWAITEIIVLLPVLSFLFPAKTKTAALPSKDWERADESYLVDSAFYLSPQHSGELLPALLLLL